MKVDKTKDDIILEKYSLRTYILFFFIFSFIGWIWEISFHMVENGIIVNSGVLYGPWLPIYGTGGVFILFFLKRFLKKPLLVFFLGAIFSSIIEYFTSWYLEATTGLRWWDYSGYLFNLNGRICVEGAILFGLGGCLVVYVLAPKLSKLIKKLNPSIIHILCIILPLLFAMDVLYSHSHPNKGASISIHMKEKK